jgi:hypothetical protein
MLDRLEKLAREAADEAGEDWFSPDLIESSLPIYSSRMARRHIAAADPATVLKMIAAIRAAKRVVDSNEGDFMGFFAKVDDMRDALAALEDKK